jgi:hypothetical protein
VKHDAARASNVACVLTVEATVDDEVERGSIQPMGAEIINRHCLVLVAKPPMLAWMRGIGFAAQSYRTVFLIDFDDDLIPEKEPNLIKAHALTAFERTLDDLYARLAVGWPDLTLATFDEWFETDLVPVVTDLGTLPLAPILQTSGGSS